MNQLDKDTVLKITEWIDTEIDNIDLASWIDHDTPSKDELPDYQYALGKVDMLEHMKQFLLQNLNQTEHI